MLALRRGTSGLLVKAKEHGPDVLVLSLVTTFAIALFSSTGQDDSHISFWAARVLADHGELANYGGQRVEQCSSLLHSLLLALLYKITPWSVPTLGYLTGIASAWLSCMRLRTLARELGIGRVGALTALAATAPLQCYWMLGGLETTLVGWVYTESAIALVRSVEGPRVRPPVSSILAMIAATLVRPEGAFVVLAAVLGLLVTLGITRLLRWPAAASGAAVRIGGMGLLVAAAFGLVTVFRLRYFGAAFPEPVAAKMSGAGWNVNLVAGLLYLQALAVRVETGLPLAGLLGLLAGAVVKGRRGRLRELVAPFIVVANVGFVAFAGGDWMVGGRLMVHVAPLLALGLGWLVGLAGKRSRLQWGAAAGIVAVQLLAVAQYAMRHAPGRPIWVAWQSDEAIRSQCHSFDLPWVDRANQTHTRDAIMLDAMVDVVERLLEAQPRVTIQSGQAGMVMYYIASRFYGRVDFIDRHGLVSRHLATAKAELEIPTSSTGLQLSESQYFQIAKARPEEGLMPDVVFDVAAERKTTAGRHGYTCVYEQTGRMSPTLREQADPEKPPKRKVERPPRRGPWFEPRRPADWFVVRGHAYQFISVRNDLAERVHGTKKVPKTLRWGPVVEPEEEEQEEP